ncbi:ParB/RepB/Spo0J family partition protein [Wansuia hejianensis]|uniref:ParB/RepB/Spo0J family partition protein n=1 Tax=Wansuia hejianensis TaxID=2763667 RepID=A0A926IHP3_9FIRM|nr:ParB/RepB/Spo0J family partition protein [Wansuia hejianensis]MBC8590892.1 ParB/RepB/Spo0J family partition protein [Wansuia hejianensis]
MTNKKRGLGKGLSALIGDKPAVDNILKEESKSKINSVDYISIEKIITKEDQPRKDFDKEALKDLSESIKVHGVIQPILLRKKQDKQDKYEIIAGERRYRASKIAGLKEIPSIITDVDNEDAAKLAIIENIQREDLNPIEEAMAYKQLMENFNLKQEELANAIGKSRSYITNTIRLLNLDEKVIEYLYNGDLTTGHGKVLLGVKDREKQVDIANKIIDVGLNVRETETEVKKSKNIKTKTKIEKPKDPYMIDLEEQLMRALGTKVNLVLGDKVGKIEIEYYGADDLERILEILTN